MRIVRRTNNKTGHEEILFYFPFRELIDWVATQRVTAKDNIVHRFSRIVKNAGIENRIEFFDNVCWTYLKLSVDWIDRFRVMAGCCSTCAHLFKEDSVDFCIKRINDEGINIDKLINNSPGFLQRFLKDNES